MAGSACFYLFVKEFSFSSVILEWKTLKSVIKSKPEKDFGNKQALFQAKVDNIESIVTYLRSKSICLSKPEEFRVIRVVSLICGLLGWVLRVGESFRKTKIHGHVSALALWCWCYRIQLCCWRGAYISYMSKFIFLTHNTECRSVNFCSQNCSHFELALLLQETCRNSGAGIFNSGRIKQEYIDWVLLGWQQRWRSLWPRSLWPMKSPFAFCW